MLLRTQFCYYRRNEYDEVLKKLAICTTIYYTLYFMLISVSNKQEWVIFYIDGLIDQHYEFGQISDDWTESNDNGRKNYESEILITS